MDNSKMDDLDKFFKDLLQESLENIREERTLSLDRYREQNEQMTSPEDFVLQGKTAVDYLKLASDRSNSIVNIAKMVKDIVHKDNSNSNDSSIASGGGSNDAIKKEIAKYLQTGKNRPKEE